MASDSVPIPALAAVSPQYKNTWLETLHEWVVTVDHKKLGLMYIGSALFFLVIAGIEAIVMRIQLAIPHGHFVSPEAFNRMFTMHGTTMIFFVAMTVLFGFGIYLVPLMIGTRDMAFPRLNAWGFWMSLFGGLLLYFSFIGGDGLYGAGGAPDVGWWAYAPLTSPAFSKGHSTDYWTVALLVAGFGTVATAVNFVSTILCMRCPGMSFAKNAAPGLDVSGDGRDAAVYDHPINRGATHADGGPLSGRTFFRYAGRGFRCDLDALLLDLRTPGGVCPDHPCLCFCL